MNWGYPVAWITITGDIKADVVWVFFFGTVCWTIVYDTIYACQDREDDVHAGVKSTAVLFGDYVRPILIAFTVAFLGLMTYAGMCNGQSFGYYLISCGGSAIHFAWQFLTWHVEVPEDGGAKFQVTRFV
ncbi:hypothetical protein PHLCEN_2v718 [Hermanssonia centrifuga]|uniref:Uncharacterized protein n=1 Tax=Hermanssonia centrifuga TaxID=98765 RepID=A0A2R6S5E4_9APHY|nr:hypothetical protein PHLCEN_2v718 [Hermanssonia centrifuga]